MGFFGMVASMLLGIFFIAFGIADFTTSCKSVAGRAEVMYHGMN